MTKPPVAAFEAGAFKLRDDPDECDLVMKGGITSGVVYPNAILELARQYRFRSIGGASAGAIAAAFAAAAEYARRNGDLDGFVRMDARCRALPEILPDLFQPSPAMRPLFEAALAFTRGSGALGAAAHAMRGPLLKGAAIGFAIHAVIVLALAWWTGTDAWPATAWPGALAFVVGGALLTLGLRLRRLLVEEIPKRNFGLCSGLDEARTGKPVLTEWIHESLQEIAFGAGGRAKPLTFGDLERAGVKRGRQPLPGGEIDLRMMTTNLSLQRPEVVPKWTLDLHFAENEWREIFPKAVIEYLMGGTEKTPLCKPHPQRSELRRLPLAPNLPVLIGVRMSLSFPVLVQAVPVHLSDVGARARGELEPGQAVPVEKIWLSDGGITSNFPIHLFDVLLPSRPTFALNLDEIPQARAGENRIHMPQGAAQGIFQPIHKIENLGSFAGSILASAKDWQDQMLSVLPGQRQRIVSIRLTPDEGGLNLRMAPEKSRRLMAFGRQAGATIRSQFDWDEHRWRRILVAYQQLETVSESLQKLWPTYGQWYEGYMEKVQAYAHRFPLPLRRDIKARMDGLAEGAKAMSPPLKAEFPKPSGQLRIVPDV